MNKLKTRMGFYMYITRKKMPLDKKKQKKTKKKQKKRLLLLLWCEFGV